MNALKTIIIQLISGGLITGILLTLFFVVLICLIKEIKEWNSKK